MNINPSAKRILVYGDSFTWGKIPKQFARYGPDIRFTGVLQKGLGDKYEVIEEGLRSRVAKGENPFLADRNGYEQFTSIFTSHLPVEILVLFLGSNDTNSKLDKTAEQISLDIESYLPLANKAAEIMCMEPPTEVVFISPPIVDESSLNEGTMFAGAEKKTKQLPKYLKEVAERNEAFFFNAQDYVEPSPEDGVHLSPEDNIKLGERFAKFVREM